MYELQPIQPKRRAPAPRQPERPTKKTRPNSFRQGLFSGLMAFLLLAMLGLLAVALGYMSIALGLESPQALRDKASNFQSTRIVDRAGNILNETFDPEKGRRTSVPLSQISPYLQQATIATEDANFYKHSGVDPVALVRAVYYAVQARDVVVGGSTITQQVVKLLLLSPERTLTRKLKEAILATEVSRKYSKDEILEIYLNELNYGNLAYGADAAAEIYFNTKVADLTLGQAALLAGLPQAPAYYDPYHQPERAKKRQGVVLGLMVEQGYITQAEADTAWGEPLSYIPVKYVLKAPHFTLLVEQQLEAIYGQSGLYKAGYTVKTTLDMALQEAAQRIVFDNVATLAENNVTNGALVTIRPQTGEILALVGSADFFNVEIDGQVNMALTPRQPGSTIKPLVYLSSFIQPEKPLDQRWTPGTLVADIQETFPDGVNPPYIPTNYDLKERGLVTVRTALANSLNIPAVRAMQAMGLPTFLNTAQRLGITTLNRPDYGLSLALGAGEIPLVEMTGAFAVLANNGVRMPPITILQITDNNDKVICEMGTANPCQAGATGVGEAVISAEDAFLITDILSDNEARTPTFGVNSLLQLNRPAAAKTGTTNDFRDVLTLGYVPQLVTGVWVGNADNSEMINISGISGAAPIWNQFMTFALAGESALPFNPPPGVQQYEVCAETGTLPSEACPEKRPRWYAKDRPPLPPEKDLYQFVKLDKTTGKLATEFTPAGAIEKRAFKLYPPPYRQWAEDHGIVQPPQDQSETFTFQPEIHLRQPVTDSVVSGVVEVVGSADAPAFAHYELQYGISHEPGAFSPPIAGPFNTPVRNGVLGLWDTTGLGEGATYAAAGGARQLWQ